MLELGRGYFDKFIKLEKMYRKYFQEALADYQFTPNEIIVLLFLYNNAPLLDTSRDIVKCKGISKGLVARSVESLTAKGYLTTQRDEQDHRVVHLKLSDHKIVEELQKNQERLAEQLECGIPEEYIKATNEALRLMIQNVERMLKGEKEK
jgi:DNA-binding MarR family transcriptional regulator